MSRNLYHFLQTLEKNQFSSATLILITSLHLDIKTTIKIKLGSILEKLTQRHKLPESARFDMSQDECDNEICAATQFLQIQKNKLIDLQESLER